LGLIPDVLFIILRFYHPIFLRYSQLIPTVNLSNAIVRERKGHGSGQNKNGVTSVTPFSEFIVFRKVCLLTVFLSGM
jgi:hypothetical protein